MNRGRQQSIIPASLIQADWPLPDPSAITALTEAQAACYARRERAVRLLRSATSYAQITALTGLSRSEVRRLVKRCLTVAADGSIYGYRGLLPNLRIRPYQRLAPVIPSLWPARGGYAGAWQQLLGRFPDLEPLIEEAALPRQCRKAGEPLDFQALWGKILEFLRRGGLTDQDYPLGCARQGEKALRRYVRLLEQRDMERSVRIRHGLTAAQRWRMIKSATHRLIAPCRVGSFVILDYYLVDALSVFTIFNEQGEPFEFTVPRWYIGIIVDEQLGAILGACATLETNPSSDSALETLDCVLNPERYINADLHGLQLTDNRVFIQQMVPEHADTSFAVLRLDNAWANVANDVIQNAIYCFGCAVNFGPSYCWVTRAIGERVIKEVASRGPQTLPSTTGKNVTSGLHKDAAKQAIRYRIGLGDLMRNILDVCRDHNVSRTERLDYSSPAIALHSAYGRPDGPLASAPLPSGTRTDSRLLDYVVIRTVRGNPAAGVRPYVQFNGRRFSSDVLENRVDLIGQDLLCRVKRFDCDIMYATTIHGHVALGRLRPDRHAGRGRSLRVDACLRRGGATEQSLQRSAMAYARKTEKKPPDKPKIRPDKAALMEAKGIQNERRHVAETTEPAPTSLTSDSGVGVNDGLTAWQGSEDPFGLFTPKRRWRLL